MPQRFSERQTHILKSFVIFAKGNLYAKQLEI
jgi:hypothetical protein